MYHTWRIQLQVPNLTPSARRRCTERTATFMMKQRHKGVWLIQYKWRGKNKDILSLLLESRLTPLHFPTFQTDLQHAILSQDPSSTDTTV